MSDPRSAFPHLFPQQRPPVELSQNPDHRTHESSSSSSAMSSTPSTSSVSSEHKPDSSSSHHSYSQSQSQSHPSSPPSSHPPDLPLSPTQPRTSPPSKAAELARFEVLETLGTGTFGRVLLVRVRSPSTPIDTPHPIYQKQVEQKQQQHQHQHQHQHHQSGVMLAPTSTGLTAQKGKSLPPQSMPHFALKVLAKTEVVRLRQVEHINNERFILSKVKHPFIVELYQTYQDPINVYMLLSYVPGGELFSHLRRAGRFTPDVTRFYLSSIILAIAYLHSQDIIYRDLKPENLLLDRDGYLRIADFGFAKEVNDRTFTLCGTPEYLAPEIVLSKGHGKAVDWWAMGILCFEMLAGYPPFFDDNPMGIYEKILAAKVAFPSVIDPYAKDLIRRLLTVDRSKRLGNLRGGAMDVMMHPWFSGVDWGSLERKQIRAPIIPPVMSMGDTQNFQKYPVPRADALPGLFPDYQPSTTLDSFSHLFEGF